MEQLNRIVENNRCGRTICFIDRGKWSDPQIAYQGKLLNYYEVESLACVEMPDEYLPSNEDWRNACIDVLCACNEANQELDDFNALDAASVCSTIFIAKQAYLYVERDDSEYDYKAEFASFTEANDYRQECQHSWIGHRDYVYLWTGYESINLTKMSESARNKVLKHYNISL